MNENQNKYLSLKTAAELYGYTRDHLGLMIRQGKLKGIKLGSYYVTTNEWITDYLKRYADPGHPATSGKFSNKFLAQAFVGKENKERIVYGGGAKKKKGKALQEKFSNKSENDFFSQIQKELLPSLQELSAVQEKISVLPTASTQRYVNIDNPYVILPIRKMEESERENTIKKISNRDRSENNQETV